MFWAALASLIMTLTGEGDDTAAYLRYLDSLEEDIHEVVKDPRRRGQAEACIDQWRETFRAHREGLDEAARCVEEMDRRYDARADDYRACFDGVDAHWDASVDRLLRDRHSLEALLTEDEMRALRERAAR